MIRRANPSDLSRIAEILVFGKRTAYRDIFRDDIGTFGELQVLPVVEEFRSGVRRLEDMLVYDDGIVKGLLTIGATPGAIELRELYVEPFFRGMGVGSALLSRLLEKAREEKAERIGLWVLRDNLPARRFYESFGFSPSGEERPVEGTNVMEVRYGMQIGDEKNVILETERLYLREMVDGDIEALVKIHMDPDVMYAYNGPFTREETEGWLDRQKKRYREEGFGLWAVCLRETGEMIGQCGLTTQPWRDERVLEIGYLFQKAHWHKGYAAEAAIACREYAFSVLNANEVYSIIRDTNIASQNVAKRNGMTVADTWVKRFRGADMPHMLFCVKKNP